MTDNKQHHKKQHNLLAFSIKIHRLFKDNEWSLGLFLLMIFALAFGTVGYKMMFEANNLEGNWLDFIYLGLRLFLLDLQTPEINTPMPLTLEIGRWLSAFATIWMIVLAIAHIFREKIQLLLKGKNHIVIIGAGSKGKTLGLDWMEKAENPNHPDHGKLFVFIELPTFRTPINYFW